MTQYVETETYRSESMLTDREYELLEMLTYCRPAGSNAERAFVKRFIEPLGTIEDEYGNHWLTIGTSPILWSCHTDTVHKRTGFQKVLYGAGIATAEGTNCLGADCTTGVWLMANMIRANVPGTYIFHRDEEIGGHGSQYIAMECSERLNGIDYAIAFDRRGISDIITHQMGGRCASNAFAESLASILAPLAYAADSTGSFTDTANYSDIIPECTNLAVGYYRQHTSTEYQDIIHASALLDVLIAADWSQLVCARDPAKVDSWESRWWQDDDKDYLPYDPADWRDYDARSGISSFADLIARSNPESIARLFEDLGYSEEDVADWLMGGIR